MWNVGRKARAAGLCLGIALIGGAPRAHAQQVPDTQQEPGANAQLRTGTKSGLDADVRIQNLLADHQYFLIADELDTLPPAEAQFYRGILANRNNDPRKSIALLEPLAASVDASADVVHEKLLRRALAEDYLREGDWAKAAKAYQALEAQVGNKLTADEQLDMEMPVKMLPLAAENPPMTVDPCKPFVMQVSKDPLGLTDIPVFVDAQAKSWMLDPTAPFNLIARSTAHEVGLKISDQAVTIRSLTGKPMQVHATVIPRFTIGGRLTLHNVTAFVFDDADYSFPSTHYRVEGVLGYAALQALGSVKFTANATVEVQPEKAATDVSVDPNGSLDPPGARFFLDGDQMIVALGSPGSERMFAVDVGGQQSYLTSRYYDEHTGDFANVPASRFSVPTDSTIAPQAAYVAETVPLEVGGTTVHAHYIQVLPQTVGTTARDDVYGVLGVDVLDQLRSYTFDYRTMRFSVGKE